MPELLQAADYYTGLGRYHHSFRLLDGGAAVAGLTTFVRRNSLIHSTMFRSHSYSRQGVGTRIQDLVLQWAAEAGFDSVDWVAGHSYKSRWAPQDGNIWRFNVCPAPIFYAKKAAALGAPIAAELRKARERISGLSASGARG